jgi:deoxyribodipyrimidine photo-lyase
VLTTDAAVMWFRRDLRTSDHPALLAAAAEAGAAGVLPLFVLDDRLLGPAGAPRVAWLFRSLRALSAGLGGALVVRRGDPAQVVPAVAAQVGARRVHVTADTNPYGRSRDDAVEAALGADGRSLVRTGTPYAIGPGTVTKADGSPFAVFTPFSRAWSQVGPPAPAGAVGDLALVRGVEGVGVPPDPDLGPTVLPEVGEAPAQQRWHEFLAGIGTYAEDRERPDRTGTSALSAHLKYGELHPRTLFADLARLPEPGAKGPSTYRSELVWREFYADVLWRHPESAREHYRPQLGAMRFDAPEEAVDAWVQGRTGYPFVDAGMRQMHAEAWMHNRLRMVVASFLVKDLHVDWRVGARVFMQHLRDGDLASNNHGWQWVAGTGTDAAPFFRVFNPVTQGQKFDPDGEYVRRYVPELRHLPGARAHTPWEHPDGYAHGYPQRIVDHAAEREEALARYAEVRG